VPPDFRDLKLKLQSGALPIELKRLLSAVVLVEEAGLIEDSDT
jgi:hypothetical protein